MGRYVFQCTRCGCPAYCGENLEKWWREIAENLQEIKDLWISVNFIYFFPFIWSRSDYIQSSKRNSNVIIEVIDFDFTIPNGAIDWLYLTNTRNNDLYYLSWLFFLVNAQSSAQIYSVHNFVSKKDRPWRTEKVCQTSDSLHIYKYVLDDKKFEKFSSSLIILVARDWKVKLRKKWRSICWRSKEIVATSLIFS